MNICIQSLLRAILLTTLLGLAVLPALADNTAAPERVLWDKRPISVHIQRGRERIIHFPDEVRYWLPDLIKHKVSALAANGVLYLKALDVFPVTRIRVQSLGDQRVYLLDLVIDDSPSVNEELIVMTRGSTTNLAKDTEAESPTEDWRVRLTRFAAQQLYAPERLLVGDRSIKRIPVKTSIPVSLIRGGGIEALPIAAWQGGGLTVTAVKLRNLRHQSLRLQFNESDGVNTLNLSKLIRGNWLTATLQHSTLEIAGQPDDTTTLYLVSDRSFVESLGSVHTPGPHKEGANNG